ncbi:MAG: SAM-dependent chlorinase/fluorinase [Deltaproteobacteria bacterium]|nr:SAM-dependent chlorinase/fluorinase [Deltaproteobacteria bacterium]
MITLTTDFGLKDHYTGAMKGAVLSVNPDAKVIDITHLIQAGNIIEAAFIMAEACLFFPKGTVHIGVVDPGVGTKRRPVIIETARYLFVGPDNGLLILAAKKDGIKRVVELTAPRLFLNPASATFHGRDIFGPAAAHLSLGLDPIEAGREVSGVLVSLKIPQPKKKGRVIRGEVIHIDSFGNLIVNIKSEDIERLSAKQVSASIKGAVLKGIKKTYGLAKQGSLLALIGSSGFLEIAVNQGNASKTLFAKLNDEVILTGR